MNIMSSNMSYKQNKQGKQPSEQICPKISFVFVFLPFLCPRYFIKRDDSLLKSCTQRQLSIVPIMNMRMHTFYILALNSFLSIFHPPPPLSQHSDTLILNNHKNLMFISASMKCSLTQHHMVALPHRSITKICAVTDSAKMLKLAS